MNEPEQPRSRKHTSLTVRTFREQHQWISFDSSLAHFIEHDARMLAQQKLMYKQQAAMSKEFDDMRERRNAR